MLSATSKVQLDTCDVDRVISHKQHTPIDAGRSKGGSPVPPKVSRGLPQKVVVRNHVGQLHAQLP